MTMTCGLRSRGTLDQKALHRVFSRGRGQDRRGLRIAKRGVETFGMARQFGREERDRDGARP